MAAHWDIAAVLTVAFMAATVIFWVTRPNVFATKGLFSRPHLLALSLVLAFGLATLDVPLVRTAPPVMGRSQWSALNILSEAQLRYSAPALELEVSYIVMLVAAGALLLPRFRKRLWFVSLLGVISSSRALNIGKELLFPWFSHAHGQFTQIKVNYGAAMYAGPITMSLLLLLSLDDAPGSKTE